MPLILHVSNPPSPQRIPEQQLHFLTAVHKKINDLQLIITSVLNEHQFNVSSRRCGLSIVRTSFTEEDERTFMCPPVYVCIILTKWSISELILAKQYNICLFLEQLHVSAYCSASRRSAPIPSSLFTFSQSQCGQNTIVNQSLELSRCAVFVPSSRSSETRAIVCNVACDKNAESVKCVDECGQHYHIKCVSFQADYVKMRADKKDCQQNCSGKRDADEIIPLIDNERIKMEIFGELKNYSKQFEEFKHSEKNGILTKQVMYLQLRMRNVEQYSRNSNIEISGIAQTAGENIQSVVEDAGKVIDVEVKCGDIAAAHRVPSFRKERTPQIVVQFHSKVLKTTWLNKYRAGRKENNGLIAKHIEFRTLTFYPRLVDSASLPPKPVW
ncbi:hypothetical protein J6590_075736 [Homalodisca vitripennis]|nr:hypothetical protein J6590_075736 [Homalodisca vitripennis]